jgi:uncharacterized protein YjbI with pentapeptide repeats
MPLFIGKEESENKEQNESYVAYTKWLSKKNDKEPNLFPFSVQDSGTRLKNENIYNITATKSVFSNIFFDYVKCSDSLLFNSSIKGQTVSNSHFFNVVFDSSIITEITFSKVIIENCYFSHCGLEKCVFDDVVFKQCVFSNCLFESSIINLLTFSSVSAYATKVFPKDKKLSSGFLLENSNIYFSEEENCFVSDDNNELNRFFIRSNK